MKKKKTTIKKKMNDEESTHEFIDSEDEEYKDDDDDDEDEEEDEEDEEFQKIQPAKSKKLRKRRRRATGKTSKRRGAAKKRKGVDFSLDLFAPIGCDIYSAANIQEKLTIKSVAKKIPAKFNRNMKPIDRQLRNLILKKELTKKDAIAKVAEYLEKHVKKDEKDEKGLLTLNFELEASEILTIASVVRYLYRSWDLKDVAKEVKRLLSPLIAKRCEEKNSTLCTHLSNLAKLGLFEGLYDDGENFNSWESAWRAGLLTAAPQFYILNNIKIEEFDQKLPDLQNYWSTAHRIKARMLLK